jgi:hypothetical protein
MGTLTGVNTRETDPPDGNLGAHFTSTVVVYSLQGIRNETNAQALAKAMLSDTFMKVRHIRHDTHEVSPLCWTHSAAVRINQ